ncbi:hypothetical protein [Parapedobacter composti]|nr:hypothetical protein [Parapedobacter composti]
MTKSSIEITDNAYLIKLNKAEFEYPVVRKLLNRLLNGSFQSDDEFGGDEFPAGKYTSDLGDRFDFLADK